jgi:Txe/YoeB family toxin of Txe-Axe toxin-antitoxin module
MALMSKLTASYLAGYLDGEGYFGIYIVREKHYISCIKAVSVNREVIEWLKNSFGGYFHERKFKNDNWKNAYCWTLTDKRVVPFLKKIIPYLKIKRKQAEVILKREKLKEKLKNMGARKGMVYPEAILKDIKECYLEIKKLNKRGKSLHAERLSETTSNEEAIVQT